MANNNDKASKAAKEALKNVENMLKANKALEDSTKNVANAWNAVASEIFKMDGAQFFKNVEKSKDELDQMGSKVNKLKGKYEGLGKNLEELVSKSIAGSTGLQKSLLSIGETYKNHEKLIQKNNSAIVTSQNNLSDSLKERLKAEGSIEKLLIDRSKLNDKEFDELMKIKKLNDDSEKYQKESLEYNTKIQDELKDLIDKKSQIGLIDEKISKELLKQISLGESIGDLMEKATPQQMEFLALLGEDTEETRNILKGMNSINGEIDSTIKKSKELNKEFIGIKHGVVEIGKQALAGVGSIIKKDWIGAMMGFDKTLNEVQRKTSINMDGNAEAFGNLTMEVAQYGVSVEQAGQMMSDMSSELRTTNFSVLANAAKDFAAIEGATGAASGDITNIAGELMRMGESSGQVKDFMEGADQEARKFGVSSAKVLGGISKNIKKMREMGFTGGEKSLTKMAITAERLKMNMDETFDMAKRARSIEGAMDMAAELQLAGGSFANINPMDLLSAARKGPAELQKILTKMGGDIGHFDKETGKMVFDPVDVDRLQMVSEATGQSMESLQNMIATNASDIEKIKPFDSMLAGLNEADAELAKSGISQMMKMGKDGSVEFDVSSDMAKRMGIDSMEELQSMSADDLKKKMEADAETLEEQNKKNQDLKKSFDNFINSIMSLFSFFQPVLEVLTSAIQGLTEGFNFLFGWMPGFGKAIVAGLILAFTMFNTSSLNFIKNMIGGPKKIANTVSDSVGGTDSAGKALGKGGEIAGQKNMTPTAGASIKGFFKGLSDGIKTFGKLKPTDLLKFAASLAIIGGAIIGFGYAMASVGGEAGIAQMVTAAVSLGLLMGAVWGLSKVSKAISMGDLLKGSLALLLVGASLIPFAFAAQMMSGVDWMSVLAGIGMMALVVFGLMGLGLLLMNPLFAIGLLIGIVALVAVGAALLVAASGLLLAAEAFKQLGSVDWTAFSGMGDALSAVVPGMLGFSLAAIMFANPLTILGLFFMATALGGLVAVMAPLAESLTLGADSLDRFASGLEKLSAAADSLSLEKLEKLKELSDAMASASSGGQAMAAMASVAGGSGGSGGGGGDVRKIEVDVKLNGRELQSFIVKDTAIIK